MEPAWSAFVVAGNYLVTQEQRQDSEAGGKLDAKELWTSRKMKPDFNDVVIHRGYCYGFDNAIFGLFGSQGRCAEMGWRTLR